MEKKLEVKDLVISFRTQAGKVQAVRDISFELYKGETLAIVGESGSGKSVTSKAIMGISAANAIVESGEIFYDGNDLVRIPEEEMHKLRGDKIAMIFQDPLSALDPIMRIGKQITEAMLIKNKTNRKEGKIAFNRMLKTLSVMMKAALNEQIEAGIYVEKATAYLEKVDDAIKTFDHFNIQAIRLEGSYNDARNAAEEMVSIIDDTLFLAEKKQKIDAGFVLGSLARKLKTVGDKYFAGNYLTILNAYLVRLDEAKKAAKAEIKFSKRLKALVGMATLKAEASEALVGLLGEVRATLAEMLAQTPYNFFRIGYYVYKNPEADLSKMPAEEANAMTMDFLMKDFMTEFLEMEKAAVEYSIRKNTEAKKAAIATLEEAVAFFKAGGFTAQAANATVKAVSAAVRDAINPMEIIKDSVAHTFSGAISAEVKKYYFYLKNNPKEEARFAKQTAKRDALIAKGKEVDWEVVPKFIVEPEKQIENIINVLNRAINKFKADVENVASIDVEKRCVELVDYFKEKASQVVYKLTQRIAKEKAIKLMEEVGIPEARIRYNQYPFEFSGGMRQRIVIAIALSANPDILICDEPTTALDVTIQAQILELINKLKKERQLSIIFITHDLGVVANMADRIAVMYAGKIVEYGTAEDIFYDPRHPYTWALLSSMPDLDTDEKLDAIPGTPPNMIYPPVGDAFADRNKYAMEIDFEMQPPMFEVSETHYAATWLLHPNAPKVEIPKIITERIKRMKERGGADNE
jgi:oligopeptide/dipeptide ABC transporter ATP-binding protein